MSNSWHHIHEHSGMKPMKGWVYMYGLCHPVTRRVRYIGQAVDIYGCCECLERAADVRSAIDTIMGEELESAKTP